MSGDSETDDTNGKNGANEQRENEDGDHGANEQVLVDRDKVDFDPDEGMYTGTAVKGGTQIPGEHEQVDDVDIEDDSGDSTDDPKDSTDDADDSVGESKDDSAEE